MGRLGDRRSEITPVEHPGREPGSTGQGGRRSGFDITIKNTKDLIKKIENGELPDKIMINVHPQRWTDTPLPWVKELVWQNFKNVIKRAMLVYRNTGIKAY